MPDFFNGHLLQDALIELCYKGLTRPEWNKMSKIYFFSYTGVSQW
jgi:hypothetical protein